MNVIQTDTIIVLSVLWIAAIAVIVYDRIKYRKYYASQGKMIVLRMNNEYARGILANKGINLCQCATTPTIISTPLMAKEYAVSPKAAPI